MRLVSDYKYREFGERFGVYIGSLGLLTHAVFLIDTAGVVRCIDYVKSISAEPIAQ
jgi:thiol peroxidase